MRWSILSGLIGLLLIVPCAQATTITFATGMVGANTQVDVNHSVIINFDVFSGQTVDNIIGIFTMKKGPSVIESIYFRLWSAPDEGGGELSTVFLTPADFTQQYNPITFPTLTGFNLGPGAYSIALTSPAMDHQSTAYFIKGLDNIAVTPPGILGAPTVVPEPTSLLLLGTGLAGIGLAASRRRK